jgi:hypothetical protein
MSEDALSPIDEGPITPPMAHSATLTTLSLNDDGNGDSTLGSPALIADREDDDEHERLHSAGLVTPPLISLGDKEPLVATSLENSPVGMGSFGKSGFERRATYHSGSPLLSPQYIGSGNGKRPWSPLMQARVSPPTTPKGHPIVPDGYFTAAVKVCNTRG